MNKSKIEDKQDIYRMRKRRSRKLIRSKKILSWLGIIVLVSFMLSAFTGIIPYLIDKYYNYTDTRYRPMDSDRILFEQEKQASTIQKKEKGN
jgi:hypothetical protein